MHDHLFLALAQVNTREHVTQLRYAAPRTPHRS
jgi:hypothetical protein